MSLLVSTFCLPDTITPDTDELPFEIIAWPQPPTPAMHCHTPSPETFCITSTYSAHTYTLSQAFLRVCGHHPSVPLR